MVELNYNVDLEEVKRIRKSYSRRKNIQPLIEEFLDSGKTICEVLWEPLDYSSAQSCGGAIRKTLGYLRYHDIQVKRYGNHVYLIKKGSPIYE